MPALKRTTRRIDVTFCIVCVCVCSGGPLKVELLKVTHSTSKMDHQQSKFRRIVMSMWQRAHEYISPVGLTSTSLPIDCRWGRVCLRSLSSLLRSQNSTVLCRQRHLYAFHKWQTFVWRQLKWLCSFSSSQKYFNKFSRSLHMTWLLSSSVRIL